MIEKLKLQSMCVDQGATIRQVTACIDRNAKGIALVVDGDRRLVGTVTDGDIRRAILAGVDLDSWVGTLLEDRKQAAYPTPFTAPVGTPDERLLEMMSGHTLRHIPIIDESGRVADVALLEDLAKVGALPLNAVVMAGGYGARLRPLTDDLPKPMLPVGDRPLLELIIDQLREAGIRRLNLTTHYKKEVISDHFGNGQHFGVDIQYVEEDQPLGTAGALGLLEPSAEPLLVINGDILTRVNFRDMLAFHQEHEADMTVAVRHQEMQVPFGVVETVGESIISITEKPVLRHFINAGIYLIAPGIWGSIPRGQACDMPDLINRLVAEGRRVVSFPVHEYWLDVGQAEDYRKAVQDAGRKVF